MVVVGLGRVQSKGNNCYSKYILQYIVGHEISLE